MTGEFFKVNDEDGKTWVIRKASVDAIRDGGGPSRVDIYVSVYVLIKAQGITLEELENILEG